MLPALLVGAALIGLFMYFVKLSYDVVLQSLRDEVADLRREKKRLTDKLLAESQRPWMGEYEADPEDPGGKVYYMDDEAMLRRERERDS